MKHDILDELRRHLRAKFTVNTADKYYFAVKGLLDGYEFNSVSQIDDEGEIMRRFKQLETKRDFSAAKRGLEELAECFPSLPLFNGSGFAESVAELAGHKRNYKKRVFAPLEIATVERKVNALRDQKLKLAYRLMLASGARVAEVAELKPENIIVTDKLFQLEIINGKGGKDRTVIPLEDAYLKRELAGYLPECAADKPVFYSASHMKNMALELGIECHDLRRAFAQRYRAECRETMDAYAANGAVMKAMGHNRFRVTRRYLNRKITF
jgi:integrase